MAYNITNYQRVWVRGRFVDMVKAAREDSSYGLAGPVQFIPQIDVALNPDLKQILAMGSFSASPSPVDGYFAINLPATDDPDINPVGFKYKVIEPTGREYLIEVPHDTPILMQPGDPLNGQRVLELANVVPDPDNPSGTVQLLVGQTGRGIDSAEIDGNGHLILYYDSDPLTPVDVGAVSGVLTVNGQSGNVTITKSSIGLGNVDNTSDEDKPVSTAQSAAISSAVSAGVNNHNNADNPHPGKFLAASTFVPVTGIGGLTNCRFVGMKTSSGAPSTGSPFQQGDLCWNSNQRLWYYYNGSSWQQMA